MQAAGSRHHVRVVRSCGVRQEGNVDGNVLIDFRKLHAVTQAYLSAQISISLGALIPSKPKGPRD